MNLYSALMISIILCFLISYSSLVEITIQQFDEWKCSSICKDWEYRKKLKDVCLGLRSKIYVPSTNSYDQSNVKRRAKCSKRSKVKLKNARGEFETLQRKVVICYYDERTAKCVTASSYKNSIFYYSYDIENKACSEPTAMDFNWFQVSSEEQGGWFSWLCWKFWG